MAKACQLFSGSSGNSIFIADRDTKFLVDAGVSAKRLEIALNSIGEDARELSAIFITHEHTDHVSGLRVLASRYGIPVFAGEKVMSRLYRDDKVNEKIPTEIAVDGMEIGGVEIIPIELSHDSVQCLGYRFNLRNSRSVAICTDTGYITPDAKVKLPGSDLVFLESNHEIKMLENGPYPYHLKQRILSMKGHLSNAACAEFASELVKSGTTRINLSHLSLENNLPELARLATKSALECAGFEENSDYRLTVSPQVNDRGAMIL